MSEQTVKQLLNLLEDDSKNQLGGVLQTLFQEMKSEEKKELVWGSQTIKQVLVPLSSDDYELDIDFSTPILVKGEECSKLLCTKHQFSSVYRERKRVDEPKVCPCGGV